MLQFVSATRGSHEAFQRTLLGKSLFYLSADARIGARVATGNRSGLGVVYNQAIDKAGPDVEAFVFVHDDVAIQDYFIVDRLVDAFQRFDVVGVVGSRKLGARDVQWGQGADNERCGAVAVGSAPLTSVNRFGPSPAGCAVVDGLFIAVSAAALRKTGLRFDEQFAFHFYDLDFCRAARAKGLRIGVAPIVVVHEKVEGAYNSPEWTAARDLYMAKWNGAALPPVGA